MAIESLAMALSPGGVHSVLRRLGRPGDQPGAETLCARVRGGCPFWHLRKHMGSHPNQTQLGKGPDPVWCWQVCRAAAFVGSRVQHKLIPCCPAFWHLTTP